MPDFSSNVYHCILLVSLYVIHIILFVWYVYYIGLLSALQYSIIRRYTNIVYYYYCILLL